MRPVAFRAVRRLLASAWIAVLLLALTAPAALARSDHGEGWWGETTDKIVTNFGFLLIAFFPAFVTVMSIIQARLDKRKDARKAATKARATRSRGGW